MPQHGHVPRLLLVSSVILEIQISVQSTENQTNFIIQSKLTFRSTVRLDKTFTKPIFCTRVNCSIRMVILSDSTNRSMKYWGPQIFNGKSYLVHPQVKRLDTTRALIAWGGRKGAKQGPTQHLRLVCLPCLLHLRH